jgi:hypothetical protein
MSINNLSVPNNHTVCCKCYFCANLTMTYNKGTTVDFTYANVIGLKGVGSKGAPGQKGMMGSKGTAGSNKGQKGDTGSTGQKGQQGSTGQKGQQGNTGQKGQQGNTGQKGQQGSTGQKGQQGNTGQKGATGNTGQKGQQGNTGQKGQQGSTGQKGQQGSTGQKGATGSSGQKGATGSSGLKGATGNKGQQGLKGSTGQKGQQGSTGQKGQQGNTGQKGATGNTGQKGQQGSKGQQGQKGTGGIFTDNTNFNQWPIDSAPHSYTIGTAIDNTFLGVGAGNSLTTGKTSVGIGFNTLRNATTSNNNTCVGYVGGINISTGSNNVSLGDNLNTLTTGSQNVVIGSGADVSSVAATNRIIIGYNANGANDNTIQMGSSNMDFLHVTGVLATTDTIGFTRIPSCVGVPTGAPNISLSYTTSLVYDSYDYVLYAYQSGWIPISSTYANTYTPSTSNLSKWTIANTYLGNYFQVGVNQMVYGDAQFDITTPTPYTTGGSVTITLPVARGSNFTAAYQCRSIAMCDQGDQLMAAPAVLLTSFTPTGTTNKLSIYDSALTPQLAANTTYTLKVIYDYRLN